MLHELKLCIHGFELQVTAYGSHQVAYASFSPDLRSFSKIILFSRAAVIISTAIPIHSRKLYNGTQFEKVIDMYFHRMFVQEADIALFDLP